MRAELKGRASEIHSLDLSESLFDRDVEHDYTSGSDSERTTKDASSYDEASESDGEESNHPMHRMMIVDLILSPLQTNEHHRTVQWNTV